MNRWELQQVSHLRLREAKQLLDGECYAGSYYLLGYAVECAIKASIAKQTRRFDFPNKKLALDSHVHDLKALLQTAGLWKKLESEIRVNQPLNDNWAVVKDWNETVRYLTAIPEIQARDFYAACTSRKNGLLPWLKKSW